MARSRGGPYEVTEDMGGMMTELNRVTNSAEIRRLVRRWARSLREGLESFGD